MSDEDDRPSPFLFIFSTIVVLGSDSRPVYLICLSFVNQTAQQVLRVVKDIGRGSSESRSGIISET